MASRSGIDPASINLWIQIASGALSIGGAGIVITQKIKEILHSKKVTGAIIKLKDGTEISLDNSSPEEIAKIIVATK